MPDLIELYLLVFATQALTQQNLDQGLIPTVKNNDSRTYLHNGMMIYIVFSTLSISLYDFA